MIGKEIKNKILEIEEKIDKNKDKWTLFILPYILISFIGRILDLEILISLFVVMSFLFIILAEIYFIGKFIKTKSIGIIFVIIGITIFMADGIHLLIVSLTTNTPFLVADKNTVTYEAYAFILIFIGAIAYAIEKTNTKEILMLKWMKR
jgi:divalent metal cation (Fe/Co/Zn/Cd) transporter